MARKKKAKKQSDGRSLAERRYDTSLQLLQVWFKRLAVAGVKVTKYRKIVMGYRRRLSKTQTAKIESEVFASVETLLDIATVRPRKRGG